jgi:hypothetical protein
MRKKIAAAIMALVSFAGIGLVAAPSASAGEVCSIQRVFDYGDRGWGYYYEYVCTYTCRPGVPC